MQEPNMISLTRLNGQRFVVNAELIRTVEALPDTTIKLINGDTFIVLESMEDVVERSIEYGKSLRRLLPPT
jgi:flagellar protein FlbD